MQEKFYYDNIQSILELMIKVETFRIVAVNEE